MKTFDFGSALELAYEECWEQAQDIVSIQDRDEVPGWDKSAALSNLQTQRRGAHDVLGVLLHHGGEIGLRLYPAGIRAVHPDPHQVTLKILDWALVTGRLTEAEREEAIDASHMVRSVVGRLGENFPEGDFEKDGIPALNERRDERVVLH